jgi:hypothetical protein
MKPLYPDLFYHDGRGPELVGIGWSDKGLGLSHIDYYNPDDVYNEQSIKRVSFAGVQVYMLTPEEVIGDKQQSNEIYTFHPAALFDCGKSTWFKSFSQQHLEKCSHFQLMFYDQLLDVICSSVTCSLKHA